MKMSVLRGSMVAMSTGQTPGSPRYAYSGLQGKIWSTVPDDVPAELSRGYMLRQTIRNQALSAQSVVYYIRMPAGSTRAGFVKIGFTSNVRVRLDQLRSNSGGEPEVLVTEPCGSELETQRHAEWSRLSRGGFNEYFREDADLLAYVEQVRLAWGPPMMTSHIPEDWLAVAARVSSDRMIGQRRCGGVRAGGEAPGPPGLSRGRASLSQ